MIGFKMDMISNLPNLNIFLIRSMPKMFVIISAVKVINLCCKMLEGLEMLQELKELQGLDGLPVIVQRSKSSIMNCSGCLG